MAACCPPKQNAPKRQLIQAIAGWMIPSLAWFLIPNGRYALRRTSALRLGSHCPYRWRAVLIRC